MKELGKLLSLVLRHQPEHLNIVLDNHGYTNVNILLERLNITLTELIEIVERDDKTRFKFNENKTMIRASQGHSVKIDLELMPTTPPDILYHGTDKKYLESILIYGIRKKSRLYVHLSRDIETANIVASRHGSKPVILEIDTVNMIKDGYLFYLSENNVWLTDIIPVKYFKIDGRFNQKIQNI